MAFPFFSVSAWLKFWFLSHPLQISEHFLDGYLRVVPCSGLTAHFHTPGFFLSFFLEILVYFNNQSFGPLVFPSSQDFFSQKKIPALMFYIHQQWAQEKPWPQQRQSSRFANPLSLSFSFPSRTCFVTHRLCHVISGTDK